MAGVHSARVYFSRHGRKKKGTDLHTNPRVRQRLANLVMQYVVYCAKGTVLLYFTSLINKKNDNSELQGEKKNRNKRGNFSLKQGMEKHNSGTSGQTSGSHRRGKTGPSSGICQHVLIDG